MGEARRRKLLDPSWGKTSHNLWKQNKQFREEARLISRIKRIPNVDEKIPQWLTAEVEKLSETQQEEFYVLAEAFRVSSETGSEEWLTDFLDAAKLKTDPAVFEIFSSAVLATLAIAN